MANLKLHLVSKFKYHDNEPTGDTTAVGELLNQVEAACAEAIETSKLKPRGAFEIVVWYYPEPIFQKKDSTSGAV